MATADVDAYRTRTSLSAQVTLPPPLGDAGEGNSAPLAIPATSRAKRTLQFEDSPRARGLGVVSPPPLASGRLSPQPLAGDIFDTEYLLSSSPFSHSVYLDALDGSQSLVDFDAGDFDTPPHSLHDSDGLSGDPVAPLSAAEPFWGRENPGVPRALGLFDETRRKYPFQSFADHACAIWVEVCTLCQN